MEVILRDDIKGLGYKNDIVKVKNGYGLNFLIPKGLAVNAIPSNKKVLAENIRQASHKAEKLLNDAKDLLDRISKTTIELKTKAGESGKIFGSITTSQISDALKAKGFEIDRKKITIKDKIKEVGTYKVDIDLHRDLQHTIEINITSEG